ncbi:hypothetical protein SAMN06297144_1872 [Sphingomonas guangdongensis]|uniref:Phage gp6-like head-tail connector protein n=1 Tax=Sphingomonas guangdongensis TaxID=1141890 RepID=A0A285QXX4_9SPHN|nr:head-tail connector protein [Sphingomonas guangdongensis]SOB86763.1 hypothetical protein SAMN06297144_1872 [Sphingomonas guangdongensis]
MEVLIETQLREWCRLEEGVDTLTLTMLESAAIDVIEHQLNGRIRPYVDEEGATVTPLISESIKHAISVYVGAHFNDRDGAVDEAMRAVTRLCAVHRNYCL